MPCEIVNQTRACVPAEVPTPVFALDVHVGGMPGCPGGKARLMLPHDPTSRMEAQMLLSAAEDEDDNKNVACGELGILRHCPIHPYNVACVCRRFASGLRETGATPISVRPYALSRWNTGLHQELVYGLSKYG